MKTKKTVIFIGYSCNNNCIFCCNSHKRKTIPDEPTKILKERILNAKRQGATYLEIVGGELTIRKDMFSILRFARKTGFDTIAFATNGRMFSNKTFAGKVIEAGVDELIFSIHGHNAELHDMLTQVPGSFEELSNGVKNLRELGFNNISSNTTIVKQNYKHLLEIGKYIYSQGIRNSEFIFVDPTRGAPKEEFDLIVPTYEEVSPYINILLEFGKSKNIPHWHIRYYVLCLIDERYHSFVSETHERDNFQTNHVAPDFSNEAVERNRRTAARAKMPECEQCKYNDDCEGYWKEYLNRKRSEKTRE